jgi:hypothetical protein
MFAVEARDLRPCVPPPFGVVWVSLRGLFALARGLSDRNGPDDVLVKIKDILMRIWGLFLAIFGDGDDCPRLGGNCRLGRNALEGIYFRGEYPAGWRWREWASRVRKGRRSNDPRKGRERPLQTRGFGANRDPTFPPPAWLPGVSAFGPSSTVLGPFSRMPDRL